MPRTISARQYAHTTRTRRVSRIRNRPVRITDVSRFDPVIVHRIIPVRTLSDIRHTLQNATRDGRKVCVCGARHTMGGHTLYPDAYLLDMNPLRKMYFRCANVLRVQAGAQWKDVIEYINTHKKAPYAMQSYCNFTVGGTASVNAHGIREHHFADSVVSFRVITHDGTCLTCTPTENRDWFRLVLGGYGLFGVLYDIDIRVLSNVEYTANTEIVPIASFAKWYSRVSVSPTPGTTPMFSVRINTNTYDTLLAVFFRPVSTTAVKAKLRRSVGKQGTRSTVQNVLFQYVYSTRTATALKNIVDTFRRTPLDFEYAVNGKPTTLNNINYETTDLIAPTQQGVYTFILHESFVPRTRYTTFVKKLKQLGTSFRFTLGLSIVNISVRVIRKDEVTFLRYARNDSFAFVFYLKVMRSMEHVLRTFTERLNDITLQCGGTFYLPYRFHYTKKQLLQAYPNIREFMTLKRKYDPNERFVNGFYRNLRQVMG